MSYIVIEYRKGDSWISEFKHYGEAVDYVEEMYNHLTEHEKTYNKFYVYHDDEFILEKKSKKYKDLYY